VLARGDLAQLLSNKLAHPVQRLAHRIQLAGGDEQQIAVACAARSQLEARKSAAVKHASKEAPQRRTSAFSRPSSASFTALPASSVTAPSAATATRAYTSGRPAAPTACSKTSPLAFSAEFFIRAPFGTVMAFTKPPAATLSANSLKLQPST
jgi:hypothetical protein